MSSSLIIKKQKMAFFFYAKTTYNRDLQHLKIIIIWSFSVTSTHSKFTRFICNYAKSLNPTKTKSSNFARQIAKKAKAAAAVGRIIMILAIIWQPLRCCTLQQNCLFYSVQGPAPHVLVQLSKVNRIGTTYIPIHFQEFVYQFPNSI